MTDQQRERADFRRRLAKLIRELESLVAGLNAWNGLHPECPPIDCEGDRVSLALARRALAAMDRGRMKEAQKLLGQSIANVAQTIAENDS